MALFRSMYVTSAVLLACQAYDASAQAQKRDMTNQGSSVVEGVPTDLKTWTYDELYKNGWNVRRIMGMEIVNASTAWLIKVKSRLIVIRRAVWSARFDARGGHALTLVIEGNLTRA